jgi:glycine/D-amino acid oxidase-like deaminating enzyme
LERTDVLIIGGGIIGSSAAYFISKQNAKVILLEKSEIGREASGANAGTLSIQNKEINVIPLAREGVKIWAELQEELEENLEFNQVGGIRVAENEQQFELLSQAVHFQKKAGLEDELLSQKELRDLAPYLGPSVIGASFCKEDSRCNPLVSSMALAKAAQRNGAKIHIHEAVTAIKMINKDSYSVQTSKEQYKTACVLNCAGVWSKDIFRMIDLDFPITLSPQQAMVTEQVQFLFSHIISHIKGKLTLKQVDSGNVLIGGGWEGFGDLDKNIKSISYESMNANLQYACRIIPGLKTLNLIRCWIGSEGRTPDRLPLLGQLHHLPGFYTASCAKGGFTLGPVMAKISSELILKGKTSYSISAFDVNRFVR